MYWSLMTTVHVGSEPIDVTGVSVKSSPRCDPLIGTSQPSSCMPLPCPAESTMIACVLGETGGPPACEQYGQTSQLLSSCWPQLPHRCFFHQSAPDTTMPLAPFTPFTAPGPPGPGAAPGPAPGPPMRPTPPAAPFPPMCGAPPGWPAAYRAAGLGATCGPYPPPPCMAAAPPPPA